MITSIVPIIWRNSLRLVPLIFALTVLTGRAQVPSLMTYQGYLTDGNGNALGSTNTGPKAYDVVFRIYNSQSLGTPGSANELWGELQTVTVDNGYFSVLLGQGTQYLSEFHGGLANVFTNNTTSSYVEMTVLGIGTGGFITLAPRLQLVTAPFAFQAGIALSVPATSITGANIAPNTITTTNIAPNTITGANIAANTITAANIAANTITPANLAASVTSGLWSVNGSSIYKNGGNIGIGTTTPGVPLDVVTENGAESTGQYAFFISSSSTLSTGSSGSFDFISIRAGDEILAGAFVAASDERIKNIQGRSDSAADLQTLRGIEITDYHYKDVVGKGNRPQKKVIAQQVEKAYPQGVSQSTDVVPDIYKMARCKDGWVQLATDLKVGDRVRLVSDKGGKKTHEVLEVKPEGFRTDFQAEDEQVFVYGREVKDFRTVDYDAISMLNVSATQELAKRLEKETAEVASLKQELADMKKLVAQLARDSKNAKLAAQSEPPILDPAAGGKILTTAGLDR